MTKHKAYDVIIVGGAMMGASVAWFLSHNRVFKGRLLVVERDPSYQVASTTHTNSCLRQQFSLDINIKISQYGFEYIDNFKQSIRDTTAPDISFHDFGYLYLADNDDFAGTLLRHQNLQNSLGAGTQILTRDQIGAKFPFYHLDDIILGTHNPLNEGYFDGITVFDWWRRKARIKGVEFITNEVIGLDRDKHNITGVQPKSGQSLTCNHLVNCAGTRAVQLAKMAGIDIPVEPRKRFTFVFDAAKPLDRDLPLTIDPSGVHMRTDGAYYMAGCAPDDDCAVDYDNFDMDHTIWMKKAWPAIANRIPQFEAVKVVNEWVGHYAYNTLDQNAIIGPHPDVDNFIFVNGFSGHGLQQSPAMGRGVSELITYGRFRTLDLTPLGCERIIENKPLTEQAVI